MSENIVLDLLEETKKEFGGLVPIWFSRGKDYDCLGINIKCNRKKYIQEPVHVCCLYYPYLPDYLFDLLFRCFFVPFLFFNFFFPLLVEPFVFDPFPFFVFFFFPLLFDPFVLDLLFFLSERLEAECCDWCMQSANTWTCLQWVDKGNHVNM